MTTKDALNDLSTLTTIPYSNVQKLFSKLSEIIAYNVQESYKDGEQITINDIGFGNLNILVDNDGISYKFIPSQQFESILVDGVTKSNIALVEDVENTLKTRIMSTYKDLF